MLSAHLALALVLQAAASWVPPQDSTDHLIPSPGPLAGFKDDQYRAALHRCLLPDGWRHAAMVAMPSFNREWAVYLTHPRDGEAHEIVSRGMKEILWGNSATQAEGYHAVCRAANSRFESTVSESRTAVSATTADLLIRLWREVLLQSRFPKERLALGFDGVTFVFSDFELGVGYRHGETWSPMEGTRLRALAAVGESMAKLASQGIRLEDRAASELELQALARRVLKAFQVPASEQPKTK